MTAPKIPGDAGEANRGIGQADPSRDEPRAPDAPGPAAGGPGTGGGVSVHDPKHQRPIKGDDTEDASGGTYGQG